MKSSKLSKRPDPGMIATLAVQTIYIDISIYICFILFTLLKFEFISLTGT